MSDILEKILQTKSDEVKKAKSIKSIKELESEINLVNDERDFLNAIISRHEKKLSAVIAEIKKASPSKGVIRSDFNPSLIAKSYEDGGAACLSVLTDVDYFQGELGYLKEVKAACQLPVLRKDFIIDAYQIYESKSAGADCILLIAAALELSQMKEFEQIASTLNMNVLVESHNLEELNNALQLKTKLIGINNRNLKTFDVSLDTTFDLKKEIPQDRIVISESGIFTHDDLKLMNDHGIFTFLIGEAFMRDEDPGNSLNNFLGK
jgi:indole-3-glycerol phosphate synthase